MILHGIFVLIRAIPILGGQNCQDGPQLTFWRKIEGHGPTNIYCCDPGGRPRSRNQHLFILCLFFNPFFFNDVHLWFFNDLFGPYFFLCFLKWVFYDSFTFFLSFIFWMIFRSSILGISQGHKSIEFNWIPSFLTSLISLPESYMRELTVITESHNCRRIGTCARSCSFKALEATPMATRITNIAAPLLPRWELHFSKTSHYHGIVRIDFRWQNTLGHSPYTWHQCNLLCRHQG